MHQTVAWKVEAGGENSNVRLSQIQSGICALSNYSVGRPSTSQMSLMMVFPMTRIPTPLHSVGMEGSILVRGIMLPGRLSARAIKCEASAC